MTEDQWLTCDEPRRMLDFLRTNGKAGERKCRLLMCALARSLWADLPDERSRTAVEAAEAFADGRDWLSGVASDARQAHNEICSAFIAARRATGGKYRRHVKEAAARADASAVAAWAAADDPLSFWDCPADCGGDPLGFYDERAAVDSLLSKNPSLVDEVFGNPFLPPRLDPAWLTWGDRVVVHLARTIYDTRRFEDMAVLADALEDAGCTDAVLLDHLRSSEPHVRGCFAVDLLLFNQ